MALAGGKRAANGGHTTIRETRIGLPEPATIWMPQAMKPLTRNVVTRIGTKDLTARTQRGTKSRNQRERRFALIKADFEAVRRAQAGNRI